MNYQILHGEECAKRWVPETEREEHLLKELKESTDILREIVDKVSDYL